MNEEDEVYEIENGKWTRIKYKREKSKNPKTELTVTVAFTDDNLSKAIEDIKKISEELIQERIGENPELP